MSPRNLSIERWRVSAIRSPRADWRRGALVLRRFWIGLGLLLSFGGGLPAQTNGPRVQALAREVATNGWIVFGAKSERGDWDLYRMRPDGAALGALTRTPAYNEGLPRVAPDGRRLLYRRIPRDEAFDNNRHGAQGELILARADGAQPEVVGKAGEFPWASWSPDGHQLVCLSPRGIDFFDLKTKTVLRRLERKGFFQQLTWSPDGRWLAGVANAFDTGWSVARLEVATGRINPVCTVDCCTPDWFPDSRRVVYSWRPPGQQVNNGYGWTQLWMAEADGSQRRLLYAEPGRHVYGGCLSPDGQHVLFTGNKEEDGDASHGGAPMAVLRLADAPILHNSDETLRLKHPQAAAGPVLTLPTGWEPHWTSADLSAKP